MNFFRSSSTETVPITTTPISTTKTETDKTTPNYNTRLVSNFLSKKPLLKRTNYTKNLQPHTQNIHLQTKDGNILGCYFSTPPVLDRERVIIYIHGRQTNRYHALKTFPLETFLDLSYTVLIPDLRSFGDCNLQYSRTGFNTDLSRCISFLTEKLGNVSVTLIGHCVGAGIVLGFNSYCMQNALQSFRMVLISPVLNERDLVMRSGLFRVYSVIRKIDYDQVMSDMVHDCVSLIREV
ncbi:Protein abhd12b, partial [Conglomerata obtusa]